MRGPSPSSRASSPASPLPGRRFVRLLCLLLLAPRTALAEPAAPAPTPVAALPCARAVVFAEPYRWSWIAGGDLLSHATAFVVHADPALLQPRDVGGRVLLVDGWPAEPLVIDGAWALVLAPVPAEGPHHAWFGGTTLPERTPAPTRAEAPAGVPALSPALSPTHLARPAPEGLRTHLRAELSPWMSACIARSSGASTTR